MKKFLVLAFAVVCAVTTQAAYLYWQVSDESATAFVDANWAILKQDGVTIGAAEFSASGTPMMSVEATLVNGTTGSFYIELYNYDSEARQWNALGVSDTASYASLMGSGAITSSLVSIPTAWTGGTMHVPEPTSAVLMLIGLAGLSLKRRKV